ncbi:ABC transporter family substrate-binding protein [Gryllotalpicola kribbensis]|uniref:ABC transporter family substrate-binding protein n=1 Tax=Gryllotalpicola kribbensis TaxID=993084 RepID=A0ABP8AKM8_9MICO
MNRRKSVLAATAALGATALLLTGCAQGNKPTSNPSAAKSSSELPATGWTSAPASDVKQGGTITLPVASVPVNFNGLTVDGNEADTTLQNSPTSGGPIVFKEDGTPTVDKDYAESVELTSKSPEVVTVKLNPKAVWQDGTPITSKDYQATFAAMSGKDTKFSIASSNGYSQVSSFDIKSDTEFTVTFGTDFADWQSLFGAPLPASIASDPKQFNDAYATKPLPSDGPFMYSKVDNTGGVYEEVPNPKWWGDKPKLDKIIFKVIDDTSATATAFANKELDALDIASAADSYKTAKSRSDAELQISGGLTWTHVTLSGTQGPTKDVKVRQAIAHAINRKLIAQSANAPVGAPAETQGSFIFMPGQKGYEDYADKYIAYNPKKAKSLLKEAGYTESNGSWSKDGEQLKLTMVIPQGSATNKQRALQVQSDLKAIGIPVEFNEVPTDKFFSDDYVLGGNFEMTGFSWVGTPFPISSGQSIYVTKGEQNFGKVPAPGLDELYKQANSLDEDTRYAAAKKIDESLFKTVPIIPLAPLPNVVAVTKGLVNFGATEFQAGGLAMGAADWTTVGFKK